MNPSLEFLDPMRGRHFRIVARVKGAAGYFHVLYGNGDYKPVAVAFLRLCPRRPAELGPVSNGEAD